MSKYDYYPSDYRPPVGDQPAAMSEPLYMQPLVNQLRDTRWMKDNTVNMGNAAADEIERLTHELAEAKANEKTLGIFGKDLQDAHDNGYNAAIEEAAKYMDPRCGPYAKAIRKLVKP